MKATIEVADRREADAIRAGLADPCTRAFVVIMGTLAGLKDDRSRRRVLAYAVDRLEGRNGFQQQAGESSDVDC